MRVLAVHIATWKPSHAAFEDLLDVLHDEAAKKRIHAFRFEKDAHRALIARLLPRWELCCDVPRYAWASLAQKKASKGRPYLVDSITGNSIPYDFNDSHDGDWVVMASELLHSSQSEGESARLGVDVMPLSLPTGIPSIRELEETVFDMLSETEKAMLALLPAASQQSLRFLLRAWAAKEAISKALGEGLSYSYSKLDVAFLRDDDRGTLHVRGLQCAVRLLHLGQATGAKEADHIVAVAALGQDKDALMASLEQVGAVESVHIDELVEQVLSAGSAENRGRPVATGLGQRPP